MEKLYWEAQLNFLKMAQEISTQSPPFMTS